MNEKLEKALVGTVFVLSIGSLLGLMVYVRMQKDHKCEERSDWLRDDTGDTWSLRYMDLREQTDRIVSKLDSIEQAIKDGVTTRNRTDDCQREKLES